MASLVCFAASAAAQLSNLDETTFIDGLAKEGMSELLLHLVETEPSDDPVIDAQIRIAQHRLRFQSLAERAASAQDAEEAERLVVESRAAFDLMLDETRRLIRDHYDHEQRPIWQTDLAEALLVQYLQGLHGYAGEFFAFGVVDNEQREAYSAAVVEALEATSDADLRFFELEGILPRDTEKHRSRINSGLWTRMIDEYWRRRTAFYLALASLDAALLPDDDPYYANLGKAPNDKIARQRDEAAAERTRLLEQAIAKLRPLVADTADEAGVRLPAMVLTGRALAALGRGDDAVAQMFNPVIVAYQGELYDLTANLAKADAVAQQDPAAGLVLLRKLHNHRSVRSNPLLRLLVTDAVHRVMLTRAAGDPAAIARAYEPYLALLEDPAWTEPVRAYLKQRTYQRWEQNLRPDDEVATLPPAVRMAIGESAAELGQRLASQANQSGEAAISEQARRKLEQAVRINETLLVEDLPRAIRAQAMYNLAISRYWLDPTDAANLMVVTGLLVDLAEQMPAQPVAERAITIAVDLLRRLHRASPRPPGANEAYRRGAEVLFAKFPISEAADNERVYYAFEVQQAGGDYAGAMETYRRVPFDHPSYFEAQRETLFCLVGMMHEDRDQPSDAAALRAVSAAVSQVTSEAEAFRHDPNPDRAHAAESAVAGGRLVRAELAKAQDDYDAALERLANFEVDFPAQIALVQQAMAMRIGLLFDARRFDGVTVAARQMMRVLPDDAAAVIDRVLTVLDNDISSLRRRAATEPIAQRKQDMLDEAQDLAKTASALAQVLVDWARDQGFNDEQMLPFELIRVRAVRLAGDPAAAVERMSPLFARFSDDANVISEYADCLFAFGMRQMDGGAADAGRQTLSLAAAQYDRLIIGLTEPFPEAYWNAWTRRLLVNEALDEHTEDIPLRVRQLKLAHPNLGGPAYKSELERLERTYAP